MTNREIVGATGLAAAMLAVWAMLAPRARADPPPARENRCTRTAEWMRVWGDFVKLDRAAEQMGVDLEVLSERLDRVHHSPVCKPSPSDAIDEAAHPQASDKDRQDLDKQPTDDEIFDELLQRRVQRLKERVDQTADRAADAASAARQASLALRERVALFSRHGWCDDFLTWCWTRRHVATGVRLVFEPQIGFALKSRESLANYAVSPLMMGIGAAVPLWAGYVDLQGLVVSPTTLSLTEPVVRTGMLESTDGTQREHVTVELEPRANARWGFTYAISLFDGIIAIGAGHLKLRPASMLSGPDDPDLAKRAVDQLSPSWANYVFVNLQPISVFRWLAKNRGLRW